jgi:hypothetical protein
MRNFIPGLKLSELFYSEAAKPILDTFSPQLSYSAALMGWGSEVLGYDDVQSSDHHWGPRFLLFLSAEDDKQFKGAIRETLSQNLPHRFRGYSTNFGEPDQVGVRLPSETDSGPVNHMIHIETIESFFGWYLGAILINHSPPQTGCHSQSINCWLPQEVRSFTTGWANWKIYAGSFITTRGMFGYIRSRLSGSRFSRTGSLSVDVGTLEMSSVQWWLLPIR